MNNPLICIVCPKGCKVTVTEKDGILSTTGNACPKGHDYAIQESTDPKRILTTTIKITGANHDRCPVVSNGPLPKGDLFKVLSLLEGLEVQAPITVNTVILDNVLGSGIDIVSSRTMEKHA